MRVVQISEGYFEVSDGDKWWTLRRNGFRGWLICNRRGQVVASGGPTGKKLIQAVLTR
ncbi:hypothetical protein [Mycolicibacterium austroafricanum]|uniref:hypothetical protein n=1 Tax=Mycolicibacterium austroafricanum TaxID=39687 RepID=UPI00130EA5E5|nr:hypothetical protein [Mycolicibacterium austroafricanum]